MSKKRMDDFTPKEDTGYETQSDAGGISAGRMDDDRGLCRGRSQRMGLDRVGHKIRKILRAFPCEGGELRQRRGDPAFRVDENRILLRRRAGNNRQLWHRGQYSRPPTARVQHGAARRSSADQGDRVCAGEFLRPGQQGHLVKGLRSADSKGNQQPILRRRLLCGDHRLRIPLRGAGTPKSRRPLGSSLAIDGG